MCICIVPRRVELGKLKKMKSDVKDRFFPLEEESWRVRKINETAKLEKEFINTEKFEKSQTERGYLVRVKSSNDGNLLLSPEGEREKQL